jgi:hypothetical protein
LRALVFFERRTLLESEPSRSLRLDDYVLGKRDTLGPFGREISNI